MAEEMEARIERAAAAMWENRDDGPWSEAGPNAALIYRKLARAAVESVWPASE